VKRGGVDIGMIYMDLYTRNDKFEYFACFPLISKITGSPAVPSCGLICNFSKLNDCLLNHREIEILFHEFGHIMHHIFGEAEYAILSSINTELDYCEIPSQILENLAWEPDIIKKLSRHYKTGNKLSDIHISNIIKSRILYNDLSHQLFYSLFDQKIYDLNFSSHKEMVDKFISLRSKVENVETINTELGLFIHMVGEYGGAYYTYLWGLEYANKIYKFLKDNPNKWDKYVDTMLKPGGTIDGEIMISNFFKD
jgi:thimet oligopeptidase